MTDSVTLLLNMEVSCANALGLVCSNNKQFFKAAAFIFTCADFHLGKMQLLQDKCMLSIAFQTEQVTNNYNEFYVESCPHSNSRPVI